MGKYFAIPCRAGQGNPLIYQLKLRPTTAATDFATNLFNKIFGVFAS